MARDYYDVLGLSRTADEREPDRGHAAPEALVAARFGFLAVACLADHVACPRTQPPPFQYACPAPPAVPVCMY